MPSSASRYSGPALSGGQIVGSKIRRAFHRFDCPWVAEIDSENLQVFPSANVAFRLGHRPCKTCKPMREPATSSSHFEITPQARGAAADGEAEIGSVVIIEFDWGERVTLRLIDSPFSGFAIGSLLSASSPLGKALLGASAGESRQYKAPGGSYSVKVLAVYPSDERDVVET